MALSVVHAQKNRRHIAQNPNTQKNAGICTGKTFTNADLSGTHAERQNEIQSVFPKPRKSVTGTDLPADSDVWMAVEHIKATVELRPGSWSGKGRAASARSSISSPESGQWNLAARKPTVVSAYFRPIADCNVPKRRRLFAKWSGRPLAGRSQGWSKDSL
ncbi:hypothetical protein PQR02_36620 [Paraburkholderia sediminicola]|uniref:Uncharacterized protein n=1 Tax=Paraburkholderia rhynchosiae TaxID=487049 RepID=A0ACC7NMP4_9BURK